MDISFFDFDVYQLDATEQPELSGPENAEICIVAEQEDFRKNEELIRNILKAVNHELDGAVRKILVPINTRIQVSAHVQSRDQKVIAFGLNPKALSLNASFKANHLYSTETFSIMLTHSLQQLSENTGFKKALWGALQKDFLKKSRS